MFYSLQKYIKSTNRNHFLRGSEKARVFKHFNALNWLIKAATRANTHFRQHKKAHLITWPITDNLIFRHPLFSKLALDYHKFNNSDIR